MTGEVFFSDHGPVRYLHLGSPWVQGAMRIARPNDLELEYIQRMMAWLLFVEPDQVPGLAAMQLGLGAGSLTKFCHKKLGLASTTAIELNPQVVAACRLWFRLPADDARLAVVLGDAAEVAAHPHWQGRINALMVDLYDHEAAAPVLDSRAFYSDCRKLLKPGGCVSINLFGRSSSYERSIEHLAGAFGRAALWAFKPTREGNTVVVAQHTPRRPARAVLAGRAETIHTRWGLPAAKWLRGFKPLDDLAVPTP